MKTRRNPKKVMFPRGNVGGKKVLETSDLALTKGSSVIFEVFLNPYSRRICLDSPLPLAFVQKKV